MKIYIICRSTDEGLTWNPVYEQPFGRVVASEDKPQADILVRLCREHDGKNQYRIVEFEGRV